MSVVPFKAREGFKVGDNSLLAGSGVPGSTTSTDNAAIGSFYMASGNGTLYQKKTAGSGTDKWTALQNQLDMDAAVGTGVTSENVIDTDNTIHQNLDILDAVASAAKTETALTSVTTAQYVTENIDTVTISNSQWEYVGGMDQGVATTDDVSFADLLVTGPFTSVGIDDNASATKITILPGGNVGVNTSTPSV